MSQEERVTQLEDQTEKLTEPERECFFCIDRTKHNFWHFTEVTDPFIREYFEKDGRMECNHDEMNEASIWFADFVACSLLEYVMGNYLERQTDVEFLDKTLHDETLMIPAMEKEMKRFNEDPLDIFGKPGEAGYELVKGKREHYPGFIEIAKKMYQIP